MNFDVSAIMPLYNAKDYFKLTVDSILAQSHKNVEVVVVDDCSTDGSLELCRELYGSNERVRILKQDKNMGPGDARNRGIREARGEYVMFVDSDDELLPDMLSKMFETAKQFDADIVQNTQFLYPLPDEEEKIPLQLIDGTVTLFPFGAESKNYPQVTLLTEDLPSRLDIWRNRELNLSVVNKMFRRTFLMDNNIFFSDMRLAEDMVFCFGCLCKCKNYVVLPGGGYVYRIHDTSLSRGKKSSSHIIKALMSQLQCIHAMRSIISSVPFFAANPDKAENLVARVIEDLEIGYIRPAYQELGYEALRSDKLLSDFFLEQFGEKAPYVEFLFHELHKRYEHIIDYAGLVSDIEYWKQIAKEFGKKEQSKQ